MSWEEVKEEINKHDFIWDFEISEETNNYLKTAKGLEANDLLIGHLQEETLLENTPDFVINEIMSKTNDPRVLQYVENQWSFLTEDKPFVLHRLWVNHMRKYEFNPIHKHSGLLSFVIFCQIPYSLEEENNVFPKLSETSMTSKFYFVHNSPNNFPDAINLPIDKDCEKKMLMFDAKMSHGVYPFFTSNDIRITCSGNIRIQV